MDGMPLKDRFARRAFWQVFFLYALAGFSSFSIAGIEFAGMMLMFIGLWHWWQVRWVELPPHWFIAPFLGLAAAGLLSALANPGFFGTLYYMKGEYRIFLPFAMLPALAQARPRRVVLVLGCGMALMALYGLLQYFTGVDLFRPEGAKLTTPYPHADSVTYHGKGNFTHHLTFAGFMLINVPLFLALGITERSRWRWLWLGGSALALLGVVVSLGRSGWVGAAVGCGVLVFMLPRRFSFPLVGLGVGGVVLLGSLMASGWMQATFSSPDNPEIVKRLLSTSLSHDKDRLYLWEAGWLGFQANPVLGIGVGNHNTDYEQYRQIVSARHNGHVFINPPGAGVHNLYLQIAYTMGSVGLAVYLWWCGTIFVWCALSLRKAGARHRLEAGLLWGCIGGLAGSMAAAFFENNFFDSEVQNMLVVLIGLALYAGMEVRIQSSRSFG